MTLSFTKIVFFVSKCLPFGTLLVPLHAEISIAIKKNAVIFVEMFFKGSKIFNSKVHFLWLVKTK